MNEYVIIVRRYILQTIVHEYYQVPSDFSPVIF